MTAADVSAAYTKAAAQVLAQVHEETAEIIKQAHSISEGAKKEEDKSALAALRAKLFGMRP